MTATHPHRTRRLPADGGMFRHYDADERELATRAGRDLRARIDAAVSEYVAGDVDRDEHVDRIVLVVIAARRRAAR